MHGGIGQGASVDQREPAGIVTAFGDDHRTGLVPHPVPVDHHLEPVFPVVEQHFIPQHPAALTHIGQGGQVLFLFGGHLLDHHGIHPDPGHGEKDPVVGLAQAHRGGDSFGNPVHPVVHIGFLHQFLGHQVHGPCRIDTYIGPVILVHAFFHQGPEGTVSPGHDHPLDLFCTDLLPHSLGFRKGAHGHILELFRTVQPHQLPGNAFHIAVDPAEKGLLAGIVVVDQKDFLESFNIDFMTKHVYLHLLFFFHYSV